MITVRARGTARTPHGAAPCDEPERRTGGRGGLYLLELEGHAGRVVLSTGRPPADHRSALLERLQSGKGLRPHAVSDSVSAALDTLVFRATAADVQDRLASVDEFLELLAAAELDATAPQGAGGPEADPPNVQPGQRLNGAWSVVRVLGTGATARALLVRSTADEGAEGPPAESSLRVFEVALDQEKDARLLAESRALDASPNPPHRASTDSSAASRAPHGRSPPVGGAEVGRAHALGQRVRDGAATRNDDPASSRLVPV